VPKTIHPLDRGIEFFDKGDASMKHLVLAVLLSSALVIGSISSWAEQPKSKAPDQGYVPEGWQPHEGGLLKYRVAIRFGEEPDTMPDGWKFGRVSAVTTDSQGDVYVFHRGKKADAVCSDPRAISSRAAIFGTTVF
jgi:hypothetical protein